MSALRTDRIEDQLDDVLAWLDDDGTTLDGVAIGVLLLVGLAVIAVLTLAGLAGLCWWAIARQG